MQSQATGFLGQLAPNASGGISQIQANAIAKQVSDAMAKGLKGPEIATYVVQQLYTGGVGADYLANKANFDQFINSTIQQVGGPGAGAPATPGLMQGIAPGIGGAIGQLMGQPGLGAAPPPGPGGPTLAGFGQAPSPLTGLGYGGAPLAAAGFPRPPARR
jgi:hypothetical protein